MKERLQKILSSRGIACSLGECADPDADEILLDGKPLPSQQEFVYIMLNKPRGYVTTLSDEKGRADVSELVKGCGVRVYPIGRLDMDSEGLLLLTNNGALANHLMHPKHEVNKAYVVLVNNLSKEKMELLKMPVELDGYLIRPPKVTLIRDEGNRALLQIVIHEGRNRQVRRMCAMAGMKVHRLKRISEGKVSLGDLPVGKWRYLTQEEVTLLQN